MSKLLVVLSGPPASGIYQLVANLSRRNSGGLNLKVLPVYTNWSVLPHEALLGGRGTQTVNDEALKKYPISNNIPQIVPESILGIQNLRVAISEDDVKGIFSEADQALAVLPPEHCYFISDLKRNDCFRGIDIKSVFISPFDLPGFKRFLKEQSDRAQAQFVSGVHHELLKSAVGILGINGFNPDVSLTIFRRSALAFTEMQMAANFDYVLHCAADINSSYWEPLRDEALSAYVRLSGLFKNSPSLGMDRGSAWET